MSNKSETKLNTASHAETAGSLEKFYVKRRAMLKEALAKQALLKALQDRGSAMLAYVQEVCCAIHPQNTNMVIGLLYARDAVDEKEESTLLEWINKQTWFPAVTNNQSGKDSVGRKVQHYGKRYVYTTRTLEEAPPIPDVLISLTKKLGIKADQIIINRYEPGEGIAPHIDQPKLFGDTVWGLSLGSDIRMDFTKGHITESLYLERRSLLTLTSESRYEWSHSIACRKWDVVNGEPINRKQRTSITFRTLLSSEC